MTHKLKMPIFLSLTLLFCMSCYKPSEELLKIKAQEIQAMSLDSSLAGPSILNDPDRFVWGGSVIKGEDKKYHMFYGTWACGDSIPVFSDAWVLYSEIAYAVSDKPDRDFVFQKIILRGRMHDGNTEAWDARMVSNPHIKKFNDKYYLYYIGSKDPGIQPAGSSGENVNLRNRVQQNQKIGLIEFERIDDLLSGNFKRPEKPILAPRTRVKPDLIVNQSPEGTIARPDNIIVVNPSVVRRPSDGKYLLYFKGNLYDPHWKGIHGVALGDSPSGPFKALDEPVFHVTMEDGKIASAEDPYVWFHKEHQKFYVVVKDFTGQITKGAPGLALMYSIDGITWIVPEHSMFMKKEVTLENGQNIKMTHLERPQILTDAIGFPKVIYCAGSLVNIGARKDGLSFNVQIPLTVID